MMTHLPPIPDAASSPFPLHPAPISEEQKLQNATARAAAEEARRDEEAAQRQQRHATAIGVGAGTALLLSAAVLGVRAYLRRKPSAVTPLKRAGGGDDKSKRGGQDRARVAAGENYEVSYFARKHSISAAVAREIIKEAGNDRQVADRLAQARK